MNDSEMLKYWQETHDPQVFRDLDKRFEPVVNKFVNQYKTVGVAPSTLRAKAKTQMIRAFNTYNPQSGTQPITHIYNNMKKVNRIASESLMSGHIPETRALKKSTFQIARDNLEDRIGREANVDELSDEMGWSRAEVARMSNEMSGEITASSAEFDFYGNSLKSEHGDRAIVDYLYASLNGEDKVIFEHVFGFAGKKTLNSKDIASKIGKSEMYVHRAKKRMADMVRSNR